MVHGLTQQLGGTLVLTSAPGQGTVASLWLPTAADEVAAPPDPATIAVDAPVPDRLKILAVDDDALILMNTAAMLEDLGHEVLEAHSGPEALKLARDHPDIDLLITDQAMPNMNGTELIEHITQDRPRLPIILATGYGELPTGRHHRIAKLTKPFTEKELSAALAKVLSFQE
jgi:CheY-like chemotaxis protein